MSQSDNTQQSLVTINSDGQALTTSLVVADKFNKQHKDVLRAIRILDCSDEFNERNFALVEYIDQKGEKRPMYNITRDGFCFLAMGFTGSEAAHWKEAFINAYNQLEQQSRHAEHTLPKPDDTVTLSKDRYIKLLETQLALHEATQSPKLKRIPWTAADEALLRELYASGHAPIECAKILGRTRDSVESRLYFLKIKVKA